MALIAINYDTVGKTLEVTMDGKAQDNVAGVNIYCYGDEEAHIELVKMVTDEENKTYERNCLYASHQETSIEPVLDLDKLVENFGKSLARR